MKKNIICVIIVFLTVVLIGCQVNNLGTTEVSNEIDSSISADMLENKDVEEVAENEINNNFADNSSVSGNSTEYNENICTEDLKHLNEMQYRILNNDLTHDEKVELSSSYIDKLTELLSSVYTMKLGDSELEKLLDNNVVIKSASQNDFRIRTIRYDGLSNVFGTLERRWTFVQWEKNGNVYVQLQSEQSSEIVDKVIVFKNAEDYVMLVGGYHAIYKPSPAFISSWKLNGVLWEEIDIFDSNIKADKRFSTFDNILIYESGFEKSIEKNKSGNGLLVKDNDETVFEIIYTDDELQIKE